MLDSILQRLSLDYLILVIPAILISLTLHELAHAKVAYHYGDPTARQQGRFSANPLKHLDPVGTICLIFFGFGWAKPVPVNPLYFSGNRKSKMALVALSGPVCNLLQALLGAILLSLLVHFAPLGTVTSFFVNFFLTYIQINLVLAIFNLIPIPPLDGSKILAGILPLKFTNFILRVERYGFIILLLLVIFNLTQYIIGYPVEFLFNILMKITFIT